ncbi:MAG: hypothetical protein JNM28_13005 [Armatimonadetes bacterium]|nr:hypothetical protein [Armatimonadota bacterium]MBS1712690.1 hypothetical protein [Armatimonadota bacterium]MBX3110233.1 hypothetical protein [Fimbriimonadaceae bacterium]
MDNFTHSIRRFATLAVAALAATAAFAGTFKDISNEDTPDGERWIQYTGTVANSDLKTYEKLLRGDETIVLVMSSGGGDFYAGIALGKMTRKYRDMVQILVDKAYSAAALWTLGDDDYDWLDDDAELGFHLPYIYAQNATAGTDQKIGYAMGRYLEDVMGRDEADTFMDVLGQIRDEHGKFAMLCFAPDKDPYIKE